MSDKDIPLIIQDGSTPFGASVIDLAEVRIRFGVSDRKAGRPCEHKKMIYSTSERRVWCEECARTIDSFDGFMSIVNNFQAMTSAWKGKVRKAEEALTAVIHRRAAKIIDKAWSGQQMAICCPHCHTGLLPEDFLSGGSQISAEIERARRARKAEGDKP